MDVQEQRVRFVVEATQKRSSFDSLCAAYEISRPTGYLWLQRYREQGAEGIAERSRKPHHSPRRTGERVGAPSDGVAVALSRLGRSQAQGVAGASGGGAAAQYDPPHSAAPRSDRATGARRGGDPAVRAGASQRAVADGLQRPERMATTDGSAVGAGRSQSLPDSAGCHRRHARRTGAATTGRSLPALRGSGSDVNGPRHALVEHARSSGGRSCRYG